MVTGQDKEFGGQLKRPQLSHLGGDAEITLILSQRISFGGVLGWSLPSTRAVLPCTQIGDYHGVKTKWICLSNRGGQQWSDVLGVAPPTHPQRLIGVVLFLFSCSGIGWICSFRSLDWLDLEEPAFLPELCCERTPETASHSLPLSLFLPLLFWKAQWEFLSWSKRETFVLNWRFGGGRKKKYKKTKTICVELECYELKDKRKENQTVE